MLECKNEFNRQNKVCKFIKEVILHLNQTDNRKNIVDTIKKKCRKDYVISKKCDQKIFHPEQEITRSTLLIDAEFKSYSKLLKVCDLITLGLFGLRKAILPIDSPVGLRLYFKNMYNEEIEGTEKVNFFVRYPGEGTSGSFQGLIKGLRPGEKMNKSKFSGELHDLPSRNWIINIPKLKAYEHCYAEADIFFKPEVSGNHEFIITKIPSVQYAGYYGLTDRPYKIITGHWSTPFYISSVAEFRTLLTGILALLVAIFALLFNIFNCL